jgi:beta-aspartyl-peptidase (threonine type)
VKGGQVIVVASKNGIVGIRQALAVLRAGGSAIDAVIAGIEPVESNRDDHTVGLGGLPNLLGEVELEASLMDGRTRDVGAVAVVRGHEHPIRAARAVLERLPHVLVAGLGAERLAREIGEPVVDLLTAEARDEWAQRLEEDTGVDPATLDRMVDLAGPVGRAVDPERPSETVNFLARDRAGNIACGVSTSGWAWKYPGRMGDTPVIGAGNYADNRHGAAACTGRGEMTIRCATAHSVVHAMQLGLSLEAALRAAMADLNGLPDPFANRVNIHALDRDGRPLAASNRDGETYVVMDEGMDAPEERPCLIVT